METAKLHVDGMSCSHCVESVKKAISGIAGVSSVSVSLDEGEVTVDYDSSGASVERIKGVIREAGYDVI